MKVDINTIKPHNGATMNVDTAQTLNISDYIAKATLKGSIVNEDDVLFFSGNIAAVVESECGRCLKKVITPYSSEFEQKFADQSTEVSENNEDDIWLIDSAIIDFGPIVSGIILADMPIRFVCSDDCKGICPDCGCDLNETSCSCKDNYRNPVFDQLRNMSFQSDKEV